MAESSIFWPTNGIGDGVSNYTADDLQSLFQRLYTRDASVEGVVSGWLNEMSVSLAGTASPATVATGAAMVAGIPYENTTAVDFTIATPATLTRKDLLVLRADYAAQTVRLVLISGIEGGSVPTVSQVAGVTWEVAIAEIWARTSGIFSVVDQRYFCRLSSGLLFFRTGGSNTNWSTPTPFGEVHRPSHQTAQTGAYDWTFGATASGTVTITFVPFDNAPAIFPVVASVTPSTAPVLLSCPTAGISAGSADIKWRTTDASTITYLAINFIAFGPSA